MHCSTDASFDYRIFRSPTSTRIPTIWPTRGACAIGLLSCRCANGCTTSWSCRARLCIRRPPSDAQNRVRSRGVPTSTTGIQSHPLDYDFEILARQHQRAVARAVAAFHEGQNVPGEGKLLLGIERTESLVHRAVVGAEHFDPMRRRVVPENELAAGRTDFLSRFVEELMELSFRAPQCG